MCSRGWTLHLLVVLADLFFVQREIFFLGVIFPPLL